MAPSWGRRAGALLLLSLALTGCGVEARRARPLRVVATIAPLADWAREVGATRVDVETIVPTGIDPRTFEPSVEQRRAIRVADVVLLNGLGLEPWLDQILEQMNASGAMVLDISQFVGPRTERVAPLDDEPRGALRARPSPQLLPAPVYSSYLWLDPGLAMVAVDLIAQTLIRADPGGLGLYRQNAERYKGDLENLDGRLQRQIVGWEWRSLLGRDRFLYPFARHYGLHVEVLEDDTRLPFFSARQPLVLDQWAVPTQQPLSVAAERPVLILNPIGNPQYMSLMESSVLSMTAVMARP